MANNPSFIIIHISDKNPWTGRMFKNWAKINVFHSALRAPDKLPDGWAWRKKPWVAYQKDTGNKQYYGRGWNKGGYHYVIQPSGVRETGRAEDETGAHAKGFNACSIGICLLAANGLFTMAQVSKLVNLVRSLQLKYNISTNNVLGHYEVTTGKTCPDFTTGWLRNLLKRR